MRGKEEKGTHMPQGASGAVETIGARFRFGGASLGLGRRSFMPSK
jgi:hypothetical protein